MSKTAGMLPNPSELQPSLGEMSVEGHNALADAAFSDFKLSFYFLGIE
jgi:hypothetical protein